MKHSSYISEKNIDCICSALNTYVVYRKETKFIFTNTFIQCTNKIKTTKMVDLEEELQESPTLRYKNRPRKP